MGAPAGMARDEGGMRLVLAGLVSTLAWMGTSSALILLNKNLYATGFPHPMMVTGMGQVFSAAGGMLMGAAGVLPVRSPPPLRSMLAQLGPVWLACAATMFYGNVAYLHLSIAFIQILKAFTPALTLMCCVIAGLERLTIPLVSSVLLVALGTGFAVLLESGAPSFNLYGFIAFMLSSLTEAMRVVYSQRLLGKESYNSAEVLVYVSAPSAVLLIAGSFIWEWPTMRTNLVQLLHSQPGAFFWAFFMSFLVNATSYVAIATTSSLTFKVAGCLKNAAVVWWGVVAHGEHVSPGQVVGYLVSVGGFVLYSKAKASKGSVGKQADASATGPGHAKTQ